VSGARPSLLVLRALGLGDLLTAVPALRALAAAFPHHRRRLAAPAVLAPLIRLIGAVDEVVDAAPLTALEGVGTPDVAVNLHGRGPHSHRVLLATRPRRLVAFAHPDVAMADGAPVWREREHEVHRWCRLLAESGIAADPGRLDLPVPKSSAPLAAIDATLIHPGAANAARRWPASRWAAVAAAERRAGRRVIVTGSAAEQALVCRVADQAGLDPDALFVGGDIMALASLVAVAGRVVVGDTGVAHLATALGTPSVVLFGPTPPSLWGPPADRFRHRVLYKGGTGDPHGDEIDAGLLAITVDEVLDELAVLDGQAAGRAA
jgi:ADP-heptose:LPS heptosyltransferase